MKKIFESFEESINESSWKVQVVPFKNVQKNDPVYRFNEFVCTVIEKGKLKDLLAYDDPGTADEFEEYFNDDAIAWKLPERDEYGNETMVMSYVEDGALVLKLK